MASNRAQHASTLDGAQSVIPPPSLIPAGDYSATGTVTKLYTESGLVNDVVYFMFSAVNGPIPKVGETVAMQCEQVEDSKEFQWIARSLKVVPFTSLTSFSRSGFESFQSHDESSPDVLVIGDNTNDTFENQQNSGFAVVSTSRERPRSGSRVTAGNELTTTFKNVNRTTKPSAPRSISPGPSETTRPLDFDNQKKGLKQSDINGLRSQSKSRSKSPPSKTLRELMSQLNQSKHSEADRELVEISQQRLLVKEQENEMLELMLRKRDIEDQKLKLEKQGLVEKLKESEQQREIEKKAFDEKEKGFQIQINQQRKDNQRKECQAQNEQLKKSESSANSRLQEELNQKELNLKEITNQKHKMAEELETYRKQAAELMTALKALGESSVNCQSENVNLKKFLSQAELQLQEQEKRSRGEKESSSLMLIEQKQLALQELDTCRNDMEELKKKQKFAEGFAAKCHTEAEHQKKIVSETQLQLEQERNKFREMEKRLTLVTKKNQIAWQELELSQKEIGELKNQQAILKADNDQLKSCASGARLKLEEIFEEHNAAHESKLKEAIKQRQKLLEELEFCQRKNLELNKVQSDFEVLTVKHQNENERLRAVVAEVTSGLEQKLKKHKETEASLLEVGDKNHKLSQELKLCQKKIVDLREVQDASDAQTKKLLEGVIEYQTKIDKAERQAEVDKNCIKQLEEKANHTKKESKKAENVVTLLKSKLTKAICREEEAHGLAREARDKHVKSKNQLEVAENAVVAANSMLSEAKNQALKWKTQVKELKRCLAETEHRTLHAERQVKELQSRFNDVHNRSQHVELNRGQTKVGYYQKSVEHANSQLDLAEDRARHAESQIETLQRSLLEAVNRAIKAEREVIQLNEKISRANKETILSKRHAEEVRTRLVVAENRFTQAKCDAENLKRKFAACEDKLKKMGNEAKELKCNLTSAENCVKEVEGQRGVIVRQYEDAAKQCEEMKIKLDLLQNRISEACNLPKVNNGLVEVGIQTDGEAYGRLVLAEDRAVRAESKLRKLEEGLLVAENRAGQAECKVIQLNAKCLEAKNETIEVKQHVEDIRTRLVDAENRTLLAECEAKRKVNVCENKAKQAESETQTDDIEIDVLKNELAEAKNHTTEVECQFVEIVGQFEDAVRQLEEKRNQLALSEIHTKHVESNYVKARGNLEVLKAKLHLSESHMKQVESNYVATSGYFEELKAKLHLSESHAKQLESHSGETTRQLEVLKAKLDLSESHVEQVENNYVEAIRHLKELEEKLALSDGHVKQLESNSVETTRHLEVLQAKLDMSESHAKQIESNYVEASRHLEKAANEVEELKRELDFAENHIKQIENFRDCSMEPPTELELPELDGALSPAISNETTSGVKKEMVLSGAVSYLKDFYGYINWNIYFEFSVVAGRLPKVGEMVVANVQSVPSSKVPWKARRVELLDPSAPQSANRKITRSAPQSIEHEHTDPVWHESIAEKAGESSEHEESSIANQSWDRQVIVLRDSSINFQAPSNQNFPAKIKGYKSAREYQSSGIGSHKRSSHDNIMLQGTAGKRRKEHEHKHYHE